MSEDTRRVTPRDLYALQFVGDPQPAPDGSRIAFVVTTADEEENDYRSRIWLVAADGESEPRPLTSGAKKDDSPRWSPDGTRLVFVSNRAEEKSQLWLLDLRGGEARQLTHGKEPASDPVWSADGTQIAYVAHIGGEQPPEKDADEKTKRAWENRVRTVTRRKYKMDGDGFWDGGYDHLFVIPADGGARTQLTDGEWDDGQPAWSPDGSRIAFISYREEDRDRVSRSDLWTVLADGGTARKLTGSDGEVSAPAFSPDGRTIAFFGHNEGNTWAVTPRVWSVPADGSAPPRCLTASLDRQVTIGTLHDQTTPHTAHLPRWSANGDTISFHHRGRGEWSSLPRARCGRRCDAPDRRRARHPRCPPAHGRAVSPPCHRCDDARRTLHCGWHHRTTTDPDESCLASDAKRSACRSGFACAGTMTTTSIAGS